MAKEQMDLQSALSMATDVLAEYSDAHPDQAKEIEGHILTLGTMLRMFPDNAEFGLWKYERDEKLRVALGNS